MDANTKAHKVLISTRKEKLLGATNTKPRFHIVDIWAPLKSHGAESVFWGLHGGKGRTSGRRGK